MHQSPALCAVIANAITDNGPGGRVAQAEDLALIVQNAHEDNPRLWSLTDALPLDPRLCVHVRWGRGTYRLHPGSMERPVAVVAKAGLVAGVVDRGLSATHGFRLTDLVEVLLRHSDCGVKTLSTHWSIPPADDAGDTPVISDAEIRAFKTLPSLHALATQCTDHDAARLAVEWLTRPARELDIDLESGDSVFGPTGVAISTSGTSYTMSPALVPEIISAATFAFAKDSAARDSSAADRFHAAVAQATGRALSRLQFGIEALPRLADGSEIHSLLRLASNTYLVVDVVASLSDVQALDGIESRYERLERIAPGTSLVAQSGRTLEIPGRARVEPLLVVGHPQHLAVMGQGAAVTLEDLEWVSTRVEDDPDLLYRFISDLNHLPGVSSLISFESINVFEHWMENAHALHRAGVVFDLMAIESHRGDREWTEAASRSPLEHALATLSFPAAAWWPMQKPSDHSTEFFDPQTGSYWNVAPGEPPVAVGGLFDDLVDDVRPHLEHLSRQVLWKLRHVRDGLLERWGLAGLRVRIVDSSPPGDDPIDLAGVGLANGVPEIQLGISSEAIHRLERDSEEYETEVGSTIAAGVVMLTSGEVDRAAFAQAWNAAPSGIRMDAFYLPQIVQQPGKPQHPDTSAKSAARRDLASQLAEMDIEPGRLLGKQAAAFETRLVYPATRTFLHQELAAYSADAVTEIAIRELEKCYARRSRRERELAFRQRLPIPLVDAAEETADISLEASTLARTAELVLEEVLVDPPGGDVEPDRMQWREILALADLLLESGLRSEDAHLGLRPVATEISGAFEIRQVEDGPASDLDVSALTDAIKRDTQIRGDSLPVEEAAHLGDEVAADSRTRQSVAEAVPGLGSVSASMQREMGFSLDALAAVASDLRSWPVRQDQLFAWSTPQEVVDFALEGASGSEDEIRAVVDFLTIGGADLKDSGFLEHWEQERRAIRIATRPLVARDDAMVAVRPWAMEGFLRRLARYVEDGRLPWPAKSLPRGVRAALDSYRQTRNDQLEDDAFEVAIACGLLTRKRVKKGRVIGLDRIPGEIDVIAVDDDRSRLWVIEVKDPYEAFSAAQLRYLIDDFHDSSSDPRYVSKLLSKCTAVADDPVTVAERLGAQEPNRRWRVEPLMVTRRPIAPCFIRGSQVPFTWLSELATTLGN